MTNAELIEKYLNQTDTNKVLTNVETWLKTQSILDRSLEEWLKEESAGIVFLLNNSFRWSETPEGVFYWENKCEYFEQQLELERVNS